MPVPCFLLFLVSENLLRKYSRNWMKQKPKCLFFSGASRTSNTRRSGAEGRPHHSVARQAPQPSEHQVWGPRASTAFALSPTNIPRRENLNNPNTFPETLTEPPPSSTLVREGSEPLPGTLPERGIITGGLYITMPASGLMLE